MRTVVEEGKILNEKKPHLNFLQVGHKKRFFVIQD
jgi:hypothetical protein